MSNISIWSCGLIMISTSHENKNRISKMTSSSVRCLRRATGRERHTQTSNNKHKTNTTIMCTHYIRRFYVYDKCFSLWWFLCLCTINKIKLCGRWPMLNHNIVCAPSVGKPPVVATIITAVVRFVSVWLYERHHCMHAPRHKTDNESG